MRLAAAGITESEHVLYGVSPTFFIVKGAGILVRQNMTLTQTQMLLGLSDVVQRIDAEAPIRYLITADLDELSRMDAHGDVENRFEEHQHF